VDGSAIHAVMFTRRSMADDIEGGFVNIRVLLTSTITAWTA
jgi:hypothetical protein